MANRTAPDGSVGGYLSLASADPAPFRSRQRGWIDPTFGEPGGSRTHDQRIKSPLLYQLSYRPGSRAPRDSALTSGPILRHHARTVHLRQIAQSGKFVSFRSTRSLQCFLTGGHRARFVDKMPGPENLDPTAVRIREIEALGAAWESFATEHPDTSSNRPLRATGNWARLPPLGCQIRRRTGGNQEASGRLGAPVVQKLSAAKWTGDLVTTASRSSAGANSLAAGSPRRECLLCRVFGDDPPKVTTRGARRRPPRLRPVVRRNRMQSRRPRSTPRKLPSQQVPHLRRGV